MALPLAAIAGLMALAGAGGAGATSAAHGGNFFTGRRGGFEQQSLLDPQQQALRSQMMGGLGQAQGQGLDYINQILSNDPEAFAEFEAPMMRQFQQDIVPGIAERFAGMGTHGAQSSSAQNIAFGQAGKELSESLAAMRAGLKQNALGNLQGMMGTAMQPTMDTMYRQPSGGFFGGLAGLGQGAGNMMALSGLQKLMGGGA